MLSVQCHLFFWTCTLCQNYSKPWLCFESIHSHIAFASLRCLLDFRWTQAECFAPCQLVVLVVCKKVPAPALLLRHLMLPDVFFVFARLFFRNASQGKRVIATFRLFKYILEEKYSMWYLDVFLLFLFFWHWRG